MNDIGFAFIAINECGQTEKIPRAIEKYMAAITSSGLKGILSPINVTYDFDYSNLSTSAEEFLQLLLIEPLQCLDILREVVWYGVTANLIQNLEYLRLLNGRHGVKLQQIHCSIRFVGLPLIEDEFICRPFVHPVRLGATTMHCVLSGYGERGTYLKQSIWYCPAKCADNDCRIIGRCPFDWTQNYDSPQMCSVCTHNLVEHTDYRTVSESRSIKVHLTENVRTQRQTDRRIMRGITVQLTDDSCDIELQLGDEYVLVGNYNPLANIFIAWNISHSE